MNPNEAAAKSGNIFNGIWAKFNGYLKEGGGFLPDSLKADFQSLVNGQFNVQTQLYQNIAKQYGDIATRQGLNPSNVVPDYSGAAPKIDKSTIDADIQHAINDKANFPNREALIDALMREYNISKEEAATKVYTIWTDSARK